MIRAFFLSLLLIYYWYFYASGSQRVVKPSTGSPSKAPSFNFQFDSNISKHFRFTINGKIVWEHTLSSDAYTFHRGQILGVDPCYGKSDGSLVPAEGRVLYDHLKSDPQLKNVSHFKEKSQFTLHKGTVFNFKCKDGRVSSLQICPSGTTLVANACHPVNLCTGRQNGDLLPNPKNATQYIRCLNGKEFLMKCPNGTIFYYDRCEPVKDLNHYCKIFPDIPYLYDNETRVECRNGKPFFITCKSGTKFLGKDYCEPANCDGLPDGTKIPLPSMTMSPFHFAPGYMTCMDGKIHEITECPQNWDESKGDNLTFLPMVFDGQKCTAPIFCDNVFSKDPDVIVPVHEFTKHVKNWSFSEDLDRTAGFICDNGVRKRKVIEEGKRISKRFKIEDACVSTEKLFIRNDPICFYDCAEKKCVNCPNDSVFNGSTCVPQPKNPFKYSNFPMFEFDNLNLESWIKPFDYGKKPLPVCQKSEVFIEMYGICSHPDCVDYAFVSQIPEMAILLPREHASKCKFYENEKVLKKEPVHFQYDFWTQRIMDEPEKPCQPGQNIQTGNFIWDSTVYATCNMHQPFIFCPSAHTKRIIPVANQGFACEPPHTTEYVVDRLDEWLDFATGEFRRIKPATWDENNPPSVRFNRKMDPIHLDEEGLNLTTEQGLKLFTNQPVELQVRYRVTYPTNVVFEYDDTGRKTHYTNSTHAGFIVRRRYFTHKQLTLPRYRPIQVVESLKEHLYV